MFVDDLFDKKTLTEAQGGGSPWHSEPEQQTIDATRQARLNREREPEGSDAIDDRLQAQNDQLAQYTKSGNFWIKRKDTQQHISDAIVGKAAANAAALDMLKQQPELRGNIVITAYGPGESQGVAEGDRPGMKDGRPYSDPLRRHPGNDSYMTPEYLIQKYQDELKKIAAGPYKRPKDVAMYKARIAKLQRQQGVAEGSDHSLKKVWDRYSKHLMAAQGHHPDVRQIYKSGDIVQNIRKYVKDHHGQRAVDDMERYAEKHKWDAGVTEGMMDNPGDEDSPVAQAIIRRILLQRTDLLAKHGPEKVGQAVDEVADFVGDVDEIGSSDVSGWVRHVEQMLGNMTEGLAESTQVNELFGFGQDLEKQIAKKEDELKALKAKMAAKTATNAGIQTGATALIDPDTKRPYEKDKLAAMYGYKEPVAAPEKAGPAPVAQTPAQIRAAKQNAAAATAQGQMAGVAQTPAAATTTAATNLAATNPAGFNAGNVMKLPGMEKYAKPAAAPKTANFGAGPTGYAKTTTSIKPPSAPSSPALAAPSVPKVPRVTAGGPTPAEKANLEKRLAAAAPAVAETMKQIDRMLESVNSKKSAEIVRAYADQQFAKLGLHNTTECRNIMAHVVHESAVRRRAYAQRMAK